jgi:hypothetical protein
MSKRKSVKQRKIVTCTTKEHGELAVIGLFPNVQKKLLAPFQ